MTKITEKLLSLPDWKRAVIKIGSALVAPDGTQLSNAYTLEIAGFITECRRRGKEIILVSSGAVAAGLSTQTRRVRGALSIPEKQAMAAIGQPLLIAHWSKFFDFPCAQLLLTYQGMRERQRFVNAKNTLIELLQRGALPIINENDTVVVDELKVGDNDNLAAHVAVLADADLLLISTDIDGLYDADPRKSKNAMHIPVVGKITKSVYNLAGGAGTVQGTGGMRTKIEAAEKATARGINSIVFNGKRRECFEYLLAGKVCGTIFTRRETPLNAKKHWLLHTLKSKGDIIIDNGACSALVDKGASLLPSGILSIKGRFKQGNAVTIRTEHEVVAKGIVQYDAIDLENIKGKKSSAIKELLGFILTDEVVHRDDMVLLNKE
jgi:glutamate 5-kinase